MEETAGASNAGWKLPKPNNIVAVPTSLGIEFFKWWCIFLRPFVNLTNREIDVVASFLKQRWELSKHISDPTILDKMSMSEDTKAKVQEETPAFTTLQSATVPVKKTGPKRARICMIFVFLAFLATSVWILYKEDDLKPLLGLS